MNLTYSLDEVTSVASQIATSLNNRVVFFEGEMGVGKTTLIKELAKTLGVQDTISSPTFSLVNEYRLNTEPLYHFDFYRIEDEEEVMDIGFEEYLYSGFWNFIEWPEKVKNLWPEHYTVITIIKNENGSRTLNISQ